VVCVGNENVLLYHEEAFAEPERVIAQLRERLGEMIALKIGADELSLDEAVSTYLFNSQLVTLADGTMALVAPSECAEHEGARRVIGRILAAGTPLRSVHYVQVRQSMSNGGGPACLRLRVVLTEAELARVRPGVFLTETLYSALTRWVGRHYREELGADDLADPRLLEESRAALDELTGLLGVGSIYPFQLTRT
jgi:succinylarginine dihydrolase